jgi:hypothetical protein
VPPLPVSVCVTFVMHVVCGAAEAVCARVLIIVCMHVRVTGNQVANPEKFPDGFAAVTAYIHSLGLKSGLYTAKVRHQHALRTCISVCQYAMLTARVRGVSICPWGVHGVYMGCTWGVHGVYMGCTWGVHGVYMGCPWGVSLAGTKHLCGLRSIVRPRGAGREAVGELGHRLCP